MKSGQKIHWENLAKSIHSEEGERASEELYDLIVEGIDWTGCRRWAFNQILKTELERMVSNFDDELRDGVDIEDSQDIL